MGLTKQTLKKKVKSNRDKQTNQLYVMLTAILQQRIILIILLLIIDL